MARKIALRVESLEVRALLSSLAFNLTTDQSSYQVGQAVTMTFNETNVSTQPVTVSDGPSIDGFNVTQNGTTVWQSNTGINPLDIKQETLQPGQSLTETATWNGESGTGSSSTAATGSFVVTNQLAPRSASATLQITSPVTYNVSTDSSGYQVGQPIKITFTETNPSNQVVSVNVVPTDFTVTQGATSIWESNPSAQGQAATTETLAAGQSITQTATWDGTSNWLGQSVNHWGTFVVSNPNAPQGSTATFQIASPLTSKLTTDYASYLAGEAILMTFKQTNSSSQPITFVTQPDGFSVQQNGNIVYSDVPNAVITKTLQPGESSTQTATWDGIPLGSSTGSPATGTFVLSNTDAPHGLTATFEINPVPKPPPPPSPSPTPTPTPTLTPTPTPIPVPSPTPTPTPTSVPSPTPTPTPVQSPTPTPTPTPIQPQAASPLNVTLTTDRPVYRRGRAVRFTLTLRNPTVATMSLTPNPSSDGITVSQGSTVIWHSARTISSKRASLTLLGGMGIKLTGSWNGRPNQDGLKRLEPGVYTVQATEGGYSATTTIRIV